MPPTAGSARIVAFDARWDPFARAARKYRQGTLYPSLAAAGADLHPSPADLVNRASLSAALAAGRCALLTGSGHGRAAALFGDEFALVLNADPLDRRIPAEVRGVVVHLLACKSARVLGPALVAAGAAVFLGYDDEFRFDPACPEVAFACDAEIDRALAAGLSAGAAAARARSAFTRAADEARSRGDEELAAVLEFDRDHLRGPDDDPALGDPEAVLAG